MVNLMVMLPIIYIYYNVCHLVSSKAAMMSS